MSQGSPTRFCLRCGSTFHPADPTAGLCPDCGGPPEASAPASVPTRVEAVPAPAAMPTRFCLQCGAGFQPAAPDTALCPKCSGRSPQPQPPGTPTRVEPVSTPTRVQVTGGRPAALVSPSQAIPTRVEHVPPAPGAPVGRGAAPPLREWQPGDLILDLYQVTAELGRGGMGRVHKVHHRGWDIDLAVKSPLPDAFQNDAQKQVFTREAETWVNLGLHPHIVTCYYVRIIDGVPRVFAECVEGGSLKNWIAERRLTTLEQVLDVAIQFAWGLAYAHQQGLIHRDVKPDNVLLTPDRIAKVTDFGLAKAGRGMTAAYCSPEQAEREAQSRADLPEEQRTPLTLKSDVWSWGLSVLEMFAGRPFWVKPEAPDYAWGQVAPDALEDYLSGELGGLAIPSMPAALADLLRQCFQLQPQDRPADLLEAATRLQAIYQQEIGQAYSRPLPSAIELRADSLNNRALSLLDLGQPEQAQAAWDEALKIDAHHPEATYNQGLTLWRGARIADDALLERMGEMGASHSGEWMAAYLLGLVHLERGDGAAARAAVQGIEAPGAAREEAAAVLALANGPQGDLRRLLRTFEGHTRAVQSVCLSADGRRALSCSQDHTVRLWEANSGRCLRTFEGEPREFSSAFLSADGRRILTGSSRDRTPRLWDAESGRCLRTFEGHAATVWSVCLSADGRFALSGSLNLLKLWEVESGRCLRTFEGHVVSVNRVGLSADGRLALSEGADRTLKLWDTASGRCLRTLEERRDGALSADGRHLLTCSSRGRLELWETAAAGGDCLRAFEGSPEGEGVASLCLSADGSHALSGNYDRTLRLWDTASGRCLRTFEGHADDVRSVWLSADGRHALSGSNDRTLKLWQVQLDAPAPAAPYMLSRAQATQELLSSQSLYDQALAQARQACQSGQPGAAAEHLRLARAQPGYERAAEAVELWHSLYVCLPRGSLGAGWEAATFAGHADWVNAVCMSADGRYALSGSDDNTLKLWEVANGRCLRTFEGHASGVSSACFSPDGRHALSGSDDRTVKLWQVKSGRCLRTFQGHTWEVNHVSLSADGRFVLSSGDDRTLRLWEVESGRCLRTLAGHQGGLSAMCLDVEGRRALLGKGNTLELWDVIAASGRCLRTFEGHTGRVWSVHLSADGRRALSGSSDETLRLWDVESGRCLRTFEGHSGTVTCVCQSTDGRSALSGSHDQTLRLWDVQSGRCLRTFEGHTAEVESVCLSADGRYALSGSRDNTLKLWALDWELEDRRPADWDEGASPYLEVFLAQHTPYAGELPAGRQASPEELALALTRRGRPVWTEADVQQLLHTLGCAGYGWLSPAGVLRELKKMATRRG